MAKRFEHLLILLPWLYRNNGVAFSEAMQEFGRTEKELSEDLTLLTLVGTGQFAMEQFELSWHDGNIYVRDNLGIDRAFRFDAMETACLLIGLELLDQLADARSDFSKEDIASLRQKLQATLPSAPAIHVLEEDSMDAVLDLIGEAIERRLQLQFDYDNVSRDDRTRRTASPLRVISASATPTFQAWDHTSEGWRSFRLERMANVALTNSAAELPPMPFEEMHTEEVRVFVRADRLELLERFSVVSEVVHTDDGATALIRVAEAQWLTRVCQAAGGAIRVVEPPEMVQAVRNLIVQAQTAYK